MIRKDREKAMRNTSLCYLEKNGAYLMMHRIKKSIDENKDKWIGVGGGFLEGESPEECARREILEETGLLVSELRFRGIVTFVSDEWGTEYMHLFTSEHFSGTVREDCPEGELLWVPKEEVEGLNIWEGDRVFLRLLAMDAGFFSLKLQYKGDELVSQKLIRHA